MWWKYSQTLCDIFKKISYYSKYEYLCICHYRHPEMDLCSAKIGYSILIICENTSYKYIAVHKNTLLDSVYKFLQICISLSKPPVTNVNNKLDIT
jgi:hypothetical protein